jgi:hypothetical protein
VGSVKSQSEDPEVVISADDDGEGWHKEVLSCVGGITHCFTLKFGFCLCQ